MLKKEIQYDGFDGQKYVETFYFHLSKAELAEFALGHNDFATYLRNIIAAGDGATIMAEFKKIISMAVGERSVDGKRFEKTDTIRNNFMQSDAYSVLFMELVTNSGAATEFITGIVPEDMRGAIAASTDVVVLGVGDGADEEQKKAPEDYTIAELVAMSNEEWTALMRPLKGKNIPLTILQAGFARSSGDS
jgi:hypothetical protein